MMSNTDSPPQGQRSDDHEQTVNDAAEPDTGMALAPEVTITCSLCEASFSPAKEYEYLLKADTKELEAAFMSMCHVCFRCRRAACPECWDTVHRLCGQCVVETGLPFRAEPAPLPGALSPIASQREASDKGIVSPFVCVRHGRFGSTPEPETNHDQQRVASSEMLPVKTDQSAAVAAPVASEAVPRLVALVVAGQAGVDEEQVVDVSHIPASKRTLRVIERVLTFILLAALLAIVALVVLAEASSPVNAAIARLLHVDIRAEVAYILMLVKHIHW